MPFARPHFKEMLAALDFIIQNDYPARGEMVESQYPESENTFEPYCKASPIILHADREVFHETSRTRRSIGA
jgi:hypothetical protein